MRGAMMRAASADALFGYPRCHRRRDLSRPRFQDDERRWRDWMTRATAGDAQAYHQLMTELADAVDGYLRARFGAAPFVEDCVQESLLAVHRARESYDPRRPFRAWLFAIVRHKAVDLLRRQQTRVRAEGRSADGPPGPAGTAPDPDAPHDAASLLSRLEPKYREALELTKLEGLSLAEAGRRAGISTGAMKTRVHRAIRAIRAALTEEESR